MDLFFLCDLKNQKFKVGLIMIDVFTEYMVIVPIKSKNEGDVASGMIEALNKDRRASLKFHILMMRKVSALKLYKNI